MSEATSSKPSATSQLAATLRDAVLSGKYKTGGTFESERKLAEQFGVNRSTVREALTWLAAEGLLEIKQGGLSRVKDLVGASPLLLPFIVFREGKADPETLSEFLELREGLLELIVRLAAQRRTKEQLEQLRAHTEKLVHEKTSVEDRQNEDFLLFETLTAATHNRLLLLFVNPIRFGYALQKPLFHPYFSQHFSPGIYRSLFEALREQNPVNAMQAIREQHQQMRSVFGLSKTGSAR